MVTQALLARPRTAGVAGRVMETRAMRSARAYRSFVVASTWRRHKQALLLIALAVAVSVARHPEPLTLPFLTCEGAFGSGPAGALARALGRLLDPRWMTMVLCPSMFACASLRPRWYAARFERACDLVLYLGWSTRHALNFSDGASAIIEANFLTYLLRPAVVVASSLSQRYEFSKQWKAHALRLLLDVPMNVYRKSSRFAYGDEAGETFARPAAAALREAPEYAFMLGSICLVDFAVEAHDREQFAKRVHREARYASAESIVAAEASRRRRRGEGSSRDATPRS